MNVKTDKYGDMRFNLFLELKEGFGKEQVDDKKYQNLILEKLLEINSDYRKSFEDDPVSAKPEILLYKFGEGPFKKDNNNTKYKYVF